MMLVGSYFIVPSCAWCFAFHNGIRDWGNVLSCESPHLRTGKTCKEGGNRPQYSFLYAGVAYTIRGPDSKRVEPSALAGE